jgi:nitrate/TMAO reductase-like tetraheme cytochrome c subunit
MKKMVLIAVIFVMLSFGFYVMAKYAVFPDPEICKACHYIAPFYEKWKTSTHKNVPCLKCHVYTM